MRYTKDVKELLEELIRLSRWRDGLEERFLIEYKENLESIKKR